MAESSERSSETGRSWATILFADVTDSTGLVERTDDETAYSILTECMELLSRVARQHGAAHVLERGDGILAVFGAPRAMEQAARAAVNAAIEMRVAVSDFVAQRRPARPIEIHAGINTGLVLAGGLDVGGAPQLALVGDAVNIAARLAGHAPSGEVIVGPETYRATQEEFEYRALDAVALKGKSEPLPCFQLLTTKPRPYRLRPGSGALRSELVGRDRELAHLQDLVRRAAGGAGTVVTLTAEAGIGKSRLLAELARTPEAANAGWLEGRSLSTGHRLRHHPFVDLLGSWAGLDVDEESRRVQFDWAFARRLGADAGELIPFLAALLHVKLTSEERDRLALTQGEAAEVRTRLAVEAVLASLAAERPLLLVFDDLQWADASSLELLAFLLRSEALASTLFVLAFRPGYTDTSDRLLAAVAASHAPRHVSIALDALARRDAGRLVDNLLDGAELPGPVRLEILEKAAGSPFFTEEIVRSLLEEGAVRIREGRFVATDRIHTVTIPGTVQEAVMARLDRLPVEARRLIETVAVIGPTFAVPILAEVSGMDDLEEVLGALAAAAMIVPHSRRGHASYAFRHPVVQKVAYERLLAATRASIHAKVALAIERLFTDQMPGYHAQLAYHCALADDSARAERYLFLAGEEAARAAASSEALHFFREAADRFFRTHGTAGDSQTKARLEKSVGLAYFNRGELSSAVDHFTAALGHLGDRVSRPGPAAWIRFAFALAAAATGLRLGWWRRPRPPATSTQREILDIRFRRALSQTTTSPEFAFDTIATLRRLARVDPRSIPEAGGIFAGAIGVFSYGGVSFDLGDRVLAVADAVIEDAGVHELTLYYRLMKFLHYYLAGDWSDAHRIEDAVVGEGERYGRLWEVQVYWDFDAERSTLRADWEGALRRLEQLGSLADRYEHRMAAGACRYRTAMLDLERGAFDTAVEELDAYVGEYVEPSFQLVGLGSLAMAQMLTGDFDEAGNVLARAAEVRAAAGLVSPFHQSRFIAAKLAYGIARLEDASGAGDAARLGERARVSLRDALRARWMAARVAAFRPEVERLLGTLAWLRGRDSRAHQCWLRSLTAARTLGMGAEQARTHLEVARRLAARLGPTELAGMDSASHHKLAIRLFAERGLEAWQARSDAPP